MLPTNILDRFEKYCKEKGITGKDKENKLKKLEEAFQKYVYEPGEAIGIVAAQSISEPATQMSIDAKEKIIFKYEDNLIVKEIGEFVDSLILFGKKIDEWDVINLPDNNIFIQSVTPDGRVIWSKILAASRHKSPKKLMQITTKSGKQITATDSHSFLLRKNDLIEPISGRELKIGDKIPVLNIISENNSSMIDIGRQFLRLEKINDNISWDEIICIDYVTPSKQYVYDFTVEETETFMTYEGIFTHNTMRSYTLASQSDRLSKVTQGLPRLIEIFDARKTFEKNMIIYLKPEFNTKEKAREIANKIKAASVSDVIVSDSIDLIELRIELELEKERHKGMIKELFEKYLKDCKVDYRGTKIFIKPSNDDVKNLRKIKNKILRMHIDGVKGIKNVVVIKEGEDWIIQTNGTNLKKILLMDEVDVKRTTTNDVHQVFEILGIEAARNTILKESRETLEEQGLEVDVRHLMLLADVMTVDGEIKDIGRYGISGKKASVLARANFEETKKHLINASFYGETDNLRGVVENVLVGQLTPIGTGTVELTVDVKKLKKKK